MNRRQIVLVLAGAAVGFLVAVVGGRYELRTDSRSAYKMDRWTGQVWVTDRARVGEPMYWTPVGKRDYFAKDFPAK